MAEAFMAYPELRHPFGETQISPNGSATVLYQGRTIILNETKNGTDLLINPNDLKRVNGFEVKPEGACYGEICVPLSDQILQTVNGEKLFNLTAFSRLLDQPYVRDLEAAVWSFSEIPVKRKNMMVDAIAPDFSVTDRGGQVINMSDLKGKKALIVTWSSW